jgi:hypothetical protein
VPLGGLLLLCECRRCVECEGLLAVCWLRYYITVGMDQIEGAMVTGCESWLVSLGRVPEVGEEKGPVCRPVGWSFVVGGVTWWAHTLFGCARTQVRVFLSTSGDLV